MVANRSLRASLDRVRFEVAACGDAHEKLAAYVFNLLTSNHLEVEVPWQHDAGVIRGQSQGV